MVISTIYRIDIDDSGYVWTFSIAKYLCSYDPQLDIKHCLSERHTPSGNIYKKIIDWSIE